MHIMLGNWWFFVVYSFSDVIFALITPASFILINYISLKRGRENGLLSSLEREKPSFGIIAFPIAMTLLVIISFVVIKDIRIGGIGLLTLSYGDGIAALAGKHFGYKEFSVFGNKKTVSGCVGMLLSSFLVVLLYLCLLYDLSVWNLILYSILVSLVATIAEAITPLGLDDLTVPLAAVLSFYLLSH